jgi:peptidylprolyl isomerase
MAQAKKGDRVRIDFTGKLEDGTVIDSTRPGECDDEGCGCDDTSCGDSSCDCSDEGDDCGCGSEVGPMELTIGDGEFFELIEAGLIGMTPGETKSIIIPAAEAFGEYDEERVMIIERSELPSDLLPEIGSELVLTDENDESLEVVVIDADEKTITFDANHPLAGEDLTFDIELIELLPA